jgi:hypothetical protein
MLAGAADEFSGFLNAEVRQTALSVITLQISLQIAQELPATLGGIVRQLGEIESTNKHAEALLTAMVICLLFYLLFVYFWQMKFLFANFPTGEKTKQSPSGDDRGTPPDNHPAGGARKGCSAVIDACQSASARRSSRAVADG